MSWNSYFADTIKARFKKTGSNDPAKISYLKRLKNEEIQKEREEQIIEIGPRLDPSPNNCSDRKSSARVKSLRPTFIASLENRGLLKEASELGRRCGAVGQHVGEYCEIMQQETEGIFEGLRELVTKNAHLIPDNLGRELLRHIEQLGRMSSQFKDGLPEIQSQFLQLCIDIDELGLENKKLRQQWLLVEKGDLAELIELFEQRIRLLETEKLDSSKKSFDICMDRLERLNQEQDVSDFKFGIEQLILVKRELSSERERCVEHEQKSYDMERNRRVLSAYKYVHKRMEEKIIQLGRDKEIKSKQVQQLLNVNKILSFT